MTEATADVLSHLKDLGFATKEGPATPFDEDLPLVTGVAWEVQTAQLALVAEGRSPLDIEAWRQLLFAGSGLRRQLAGDDMSAFGTPVVVAIVDVDGGKELRELAESLAENFALFNRVDLNLVLEGDLRDEERLDDALAPLLPRCRRLLGKEIARSEVQEFWKVLRVEVGQAAKKLDSRFGEQRLETGRECADVLIGDSEEAEELPPPMPIGKIAIHHMRSIEEMALDLGAVTVIHGTNGSGKTTLVEAMELAWAGRSQRVPDGVATDEYAEHLARGGEGAFRVDHDGASVFAPKDRPAAQLNRCVLTHEAMNRLVSDDPEDRFTALLEVTGLEIPDLKTRTGALQSDSKTAVDRALSAAGMSNLPRAGAVGLKHLDSELGSQLLQDFEALRSVTRVEATLAALSDAFERRQWKAAARLPDLLDAADRAIAGAIAGETSAEQLDNTLDEAGEAIGELLAERSQAAAASRVLLEALREQARSERDLAPSDDIQQEDPPMPPTLAARWLSHSASLSSEAERFRIDADAIAEEPWKQRLLEYVLALERASELAPRDELGRFSKPTVRARPTPQTTPADEVLRAAGFRSGDIVPTHVGPVLRELSDALDRQVGELRRIENQLATHPARNFTEHAPAVMSALCRYELARTLRREGPILEASEQLVSRLLDERLAPVVRELMAAIVRFEWYFKPLKMSSHDRRIVLGGLATDRGDLDARLLLNSAERTVLGLSWFCALHMLQPETHRQVLVMDDPTAGFDSINTAGFASTFRAFVRLLRPSQVVVVSHDDRVAAMLGDELARVDAWPDTVTRFRLSRDANDCSVAHPNPLPDRERRVAADSERLGIGEASVA
jgi:energy-coupling factor transporter ATP-binding protein EcfA2